MFNISATRAFLTPRKTCFLCFKGKRHETNQAFSPWGIDLKKIAFLYEMFDFICNCVELGPVLRKGLLQGKS